MAFRFMDNECINLTSSIGRDTRVIPVGVGDRSKLQQYLTDTNDYTYLTLTTPLGSEIVRVYFVNNLPYMDRAQGGTNPLSAAAGSCMCFRYNKLILDEYVSGIQEPCRVTIVSDDLEVIEPEEGECEWTVNFTQDFIDRLEICCPSGNCPDCNVVNGTYENATVTIRNGRICEISNGRNIVYTGGSCCNCGSDDG